MGVEEGGAGAVEKIQAAGGTVETGDDDEWGEFEDEDEDGTSRWEST